MYRHTRMVPDLYLARKLSLGQNPLVQDMTSTVEQEGQVLRPIGHHVLKVRGGGLGFDDHTPLVIEDVLDGVVKIGEARQLKAHFDQRTRPRSH